MDLTRINEHNRTALLRVLAMLFAMVGLVRGGSVATLPRHLRLSVLRLLRPAESAALRLIVAAAQALNVPVPATRRAAPASTKKPPKREAQEIKPSFRLVEPLQQTAPPAPRPTAAPGPRMSFFGGFDPAIETPPPPPSPDDLMDTARLSRRLLALQMALDNLPKHAMRLARWQVRRAADQNRGRTRAIRPGRPPGYRARAMHEIDGILKDCHDLALRALVPPDTS